MYKGISLYIKFYIEGLYMKMKFIDIIVDLILITIIFCLTDIITTHVIHNNIMWVDLGVYVLLYGMFFGLKKVITLLWVKNHHD